VLDLGSGGVIDVLLSARRTGETVVVGAGQAGLAAGMAMR
jgi:hypothetical protein